MRSSRQIWDQFSKRFRQFQTRPLCTNNKPSKLTSITHNNGTDISREGNGDEASSSISRQEAYKRLENLDFMTATKILFTTPPKRKKFGYSSTLNRAKKASLLLVMVYVMSSILFAGGLFLAFYRSVYRLAVYLVAQYARSEMRRMEEELEVKTRAEEEAKAKEMELKAAEEQNEKSDPQLLEVKERLDKLEEAVKEIVVESKKKSSDSSENSEADKCETKQPTIVKPNGIGTNAGHSTS